MRLILPALIPAALALTVPANAADTVGINAAIRNQVMTKPPSVAAPRPAVLKARVMLGEQVVTQSNSMLQILLLDRSNFTVGANAQVIIDRFVFDANRSASAVGASVARGAFRFVSGKSVRRLPGQTKVRTPAASIGVRGTVFEGVVGPEAVRIAFGEAGARGVRGDPASATLIVLRGPAATATEPGGAIDVEAGGETVAVDQPGMAVFVPAAGQKPIGPFALSDQGLLALHDLLRTTPDTRGNTIAFDPEGNPIVDRTLEDLPAIRGDVPINVIDGPQ
jgi:hypothetical protein